MSEQDRPDRDRPAPDRPGHDAPRPAKRPGRPFAEALASDVALTARADRYQPEHAPADYDGRFGPRFDSEVDVRGVFWVGIGIAVATVLGMLIVLLMIRAFSGTVPEGAGVGMPADLVAPARFPEGPLLQPHPEAELQALRREMAEDLERWRWDDEAAGTVVLPVDVAIDYVAARGLPSRGETTPPEPPAAPPAEETAADVVPADEPPPEDGR